MSSKQRLDAFDMLISILREHDEKLEFLSERIEMVSDTLGANPDLKDRLNLLETEQLDGEPSPSILLVDDDNALTQSFKMVLESAGFQVDTASTGEEATLKVRDKIYDLAILDLNLPDMLGDEVAARIDECVKDIIFITGYSSLSEVVESNIRRERELILKPIEPTDLLKLARAYRR
jgi:CheY-like chemotaxis protein